MAIKRIIRWVFQFILALFLAISAFSLFPLTILLFTCIKSGVCMCAKIFRKDLRDCMTSPSTIMAQENILTKPELNVCVGLVYDGPIHLEHLRTIFEERIVQKLRPDGNLMYPELTQYWTSFWNYTFWKSEENFDIRKHVRLSAPVVQQEQEDRFRHENNLPHLLSSLLEKPWKEAQSPWELLLVQNFKSCRQLPPPKGHSDADHPHPLKSSTLLIFRIHHAMGDGYSILKLLLRDLQLVPPNFKIKFEPMTKWEQIGFCAIFPFKLPWDLAGGMMDLYDGENSWHGWGQNHKLSRKIMTSLSKPIDMELIKNIKNKYGVGYNHVLCAAAARSCQRLMEEAGQIVPKQISCYTPIPLAGHPDGLVNHLTGHAFKWEMNSKLSRKERLLTLSKRMSPSKYYTAPFGFSLMSRVCSLLPNFVFKLRGLTPFTIALTSFPAPQDSPTFNGLGVKLIDVFASVGPGMGRVGTILCLVSCNGRQRFSINIDKDIFPCEKIFENFGQYVQEELYALWEAGHVKE